MGLDVLLVGRLRPELGVQGDCEGVSAVDVRHPEAVQSAVAALGAGGTPVLVVCEQREAAAVRHQLGWLHAALPHVTTVLEPVNGPPLAVNAVATLVSEAGGDRDGATQLACLDRLRERIWSAVWLPSVARLARPAPRVSQHVRSWLPGPGFLALTADDRVVAARQDEPMAELASVPPGGQLLVADSGAPGWVVAAVADAVRAERRIDMDTWRDPRDAYGVGSAAEFVLLPPGAADLADLDTSGMEACWGCGRRNPRAVCAFCGMSRQYSVVLGESSASIPLRVPRRE